MRVRPYTLASFLRGRIEAGTEGNLSQERVWRKLKGGELAGLSYIEGESD